MNDISLGGWRGFRDVVQHSLMTVARTLWQRIPIQKRVPITVAIYSVGLLFSLWLSYEVRYDFAMAPEDWSQFWKVALWLIPLKLASLLMIGQFAGLLSYFGVPDLRRLAVALGGSFVTAGSVWIITDGQLSPPRSVMVADFFLSFLVLCSIRLVCRRIREMSTEGLGARVLMRRVAIVGAGEEGATLACELLAKRRFGMRPILFLDDNPAKWESRLHDIVVAGPPELLLTKAAEWKLDKVIIAMPNASPRRLRDLIKVLQEVGIEFATVPSVEQLASGRVQISQIRPVEITDLLGREPVQLEIDNILGLLKDQVVMVTGAGGSIGAELCRQIAEQHPRRLLLVERSEVQMFQIEQELVRNGFDQVVMPLIADILDEPRMREIFERYCPSIVFHAAAHKHVPLMERHPTEAIKNNTLGTVQLAKLSAEYRVHRFVLISTDKAINPTSVMGASKRLAEVFLQAMSAHNGHETQFMAVRFGNVLGSSGSVVPTFKEQIAKGGPVTVTHPEMTRYFMTIPEAVGLVLQCATQGSGGEIFVLDMGEPVKIVDLAKQLIELSGLTPGKDIEIRFVGLRPGEKLFEEISHNGENMKSTDHPKIMRFLCPPPSFEWVEESLFELEASLHMGHPFRLKLLLKQMIPEYQPSLHVDPSWGQHVADPLPVKDSQTPRQPLLAFCQKES